ncbi:MAG: glycoside hydrolase family 16 protein [Aquabacterium sp.]|uniref:glycoside hydrolase family 16 protein n=1 Tax=Aquabacterium sp. TaxID=1872578 RepID=UPI00271D71C5|nr:glycoside hydrolase family 16 protein [Aquabacterium sp.]MDO9002137.1 glycoside hydrolase family 16 protein [Aquabacterium sp.]
MLFRSLTGFKWVCALSLVAMTTACGGGGGTSTTTPPSSATPPATPAAVTSPAPAPTPSLPAPPATELALNPQFSQGLAFWSVTDGVLTPSLLRAGGQALDLGWQAVQPLSSSTLVPGRSYTLRVKAKLANAGQASTASVNFRLANGWEVFRTYKVAIDSSAFKDYEINFTAPAYVGKADITLVTSGTRTVIDSTSLTMRATISQTEPIASSQGSHVPANYTLAFNDEFNGTTLNRQKWFTRFIQVGGTLDTLNDEQQRYTDNNTHMVANGVLSLTARPVNSSTNAGLPYESGMIRSDWTARYGYYEARVKMPGGVGVWPAFWLNSDASDTGRLSWPPEIDIFEFVNNGVEDTTRMLHSGISASALYPSAYLYADPAFDKMWTFWAAPFHFHEGWHTVGAEWTPESVTLYIDGMKIYTRTHSWTYSDGALAGPAHIILNLAIGGQWAGRHGIDNTAFPQALQIDWVRAYRKVSP